MCACVRVCGACVCVCACACLFFFSFFLSSSLSSSLSFFLPLFLPLLIVLFCAVLVGPSWCLSWQRTMPSQTGGKSLAPQMPKRPANLHHTGKQPTHAMCRCGCACTMPWPASPPGVCHVHAHTLSLTLSGTPLQPSHNRTPQPARQVRLGTHAECTARE